MLEWRNQEVSARSIHLQRAGSKDPLLALEQAFSAFPDSIPPQDVEKRLELYEAMLSKIPKEELNPKSEEPSLRTPDQKFSYGLYDSIVALDAYIHKHQDEFPLDEKF